MRTAAHRLLVALLLALIGVGYLAGGPGVRAQDDPVGGAGDGSLQLGLPIPVGEEWSATPNWPSGVAENGDPTPAMWFNRNASGSGPSGMGAPVLAMRGGVVSLPCAGMVKIDHGGGISSVYTPVGNIAVTAGQTVARGQRLGGTVESGACSGANNGLGPGTLSVWVQRNGVDISLVGHDIGGWTVRADHYLERGSTIGANFQVVNDGEVGSTTRPFAAVSTSIARNSYAVGEPIGYKLVGFPENVPVTLEWRRFDGSIVALGTTRTSGGGTAEGRVTVPETPREAHSGLVARTSTVTRRALVFVDTALTSSTAVVVRGETVTLRVTGHTANSSIPVSVRYAGQGIQTLPQQITTNYLGSGTVTVAISASAPFGAGEFSIVDFYRYIAPSYFEVVGQPTISLSFDSPRRDVYPGDEVVSYLRKFPANTDVTVVLQRKLHVREDPTGPIYPLGTGRTDAAGAASISGTIPADIDGGLFEIRAAGGGRTATTMSGIGGRFTLSPASAPPGGQVTLNLTGWEAGYPLTLDWWDGELWQPLGDFTVPTSRGLALVVPTEATPGLVARIGMRQVNDYGTRYWLTQASFLVTDPGSNTPPRANAGADRTVTSTSDSGVAVALSGSGSSDPGGGIASYTWRENGTQIATGVSPTVTLTAGEHTIQLTVVDNGGLAAVDTVVIMVVRPPVARAGQDQTVADPQGNGEQVYLSGYDSVDPDSDFDIAAYLWKEGATTLATTADFSRTFTPGVHTIALTVTDVDGYTGTDTVVITVVPPQRPVANAGLDQTVADTDGGGEEVFLNGFDSTDSDGSIVSWVWKEGTRQLGNIEGPAVTLAVGIHTIVLTVTDNAGLTATDTVVITVTGPPPPATLTVDPDGASADSSKFNGLVTATLTGFTPNSAVTLKWPNIYPVDVDGTRTTDLLGSGTTDAAGRLTLRFRTPLQPFVAAGYLVTARDAAGRSATDILRVIPRILLNEEAGTGSTRLRVYFYGFAPNERIEVRWHAGPDGTSSSSVIFTLTVAANGRAVSTAFLPPAGSLGAHKVVGKVIGVNRSASTTFTLTAGVASVDDPTPTPTTTSTATPTPTATATPTATPTPEATATATAITEPTATPNPAQEPAPTETPTPEPTATATPIPNASPVAAAGEDRTVTDADGTGDEPVTLDGGGSTDPEGAELTYAWTVDGVEVATGVTPSVALPVGTTTMVVTVTDAAGATATDEVSITVEAAPPAAPAEGQGDAPAESAAVAARGGV